MPKDIIQAVNEIDTITNKIQFDHFDSDQHTVQQNYFGNTQDGNQEHCISIVNSNYESDGHLDDSQQINGTNSDTKFPYTNEILPLVGSDISTIVSMKCASIDISAHVSSKCVFTDVSTERVSTNVSLENVYTEASTDVSTNTYSSNSGASLQNLLDQWVEFRYDQYIFPTEIIQLTATSIINNS